jgi:hypothetical protein
MSRRDRLITKHKLGVLKDKIMEEIKELPAAKACPKKTKSAKCKKE